MQGHVSVRRSEDVANRQKDTLVKLVLGLLDVLVRDIVTHLNT